MWVPFLISNCRWMLQLFVNITFSMLPTSLSDIIVDGVCLQFYIPLFRAFSQPVLALQTLQATAVCILCPTTKFIQVSRDRVSVTRELCPLCCRIAFSRARNWKATQATRTWLICRAAHYWQESSAVPMPEVNKSTPGIVTCAVSCATNKIPMQWKSRNIAFISLYTSVQWTPVISSIYFVHVLKM